MRTTALFIVVIACIAIVSVAHSKCVGVDHVTLSSSSLVYDMWFVEGTTIPQTVRLTIDNVGAGTTVEYYNAGQWTTVSGSYDGDATECRFTEGGSVSISYEIGNCWDVVQPQDE